MIASPYPSSGRPWCNGEWTVESGELRRSTYSNSPLQQEVHVRFKTREGTERNNGNMYLTATTVRRGDTNQKQKKIFFSPLSPGSQDQEKRREL